MALSIKNGWNFNISKNNSLQRDENVLMLMSRTGENSPGCLIGVRGERGLHDVSLLDE